MQPVSRIVRMQRAVVFAFLIGLWPAMASAGQLQSSQQSFAEILRDSNDYLDLVREYWPRVANGDVLAMTVVFAALNNCDQFKDEIKTAENVDELEELLSGRNPTDVLFAKGSYYKCKRLADDFAEFPGWEGLRLRAALAGDTDSAIWMAFEYYRRKDELPREAFPYSPAAFLTDAMAAGQSMVFGMIAETAPYYELVRDKSRVTRVAWWLVSCKFRDDCDKPESMHNLCNFMAPECTRFENMYEVFRSRSGSDTVFAQAQARADELYLAVRQMRYEDLGLNLVW